MTIIHFVLLTAASFLSVYMLRVLCLRLSLLDNPNARSSHDIPTPRLGGIGLLIPFFISLIIFIPWTTIQDNIVILLAFALLFGISLIDDLKDISPKLRLINHILFSVLIVSSGLSLSSLTLPFGLITISGAVSVIITLIYCVAWINIYNFMDGMNGYAAMMGIFGFTSFIILSQAGSNSTAGIVSFCIVACLLGFSFLNAYKAKIFMGDSGSAFLGGLVAVMTIAIPSGSVEQKGLDLLIGLLCFSPFLFDATLTIIKRAIKRENVLSAHRQHFYQLLLRSGWQHHSVLMIECMHMGVNALLLWMYVNNPNDRIMLFALFFCLYIAKYAFVLREFFGKGE